MRSVVITKNVVSAQHSHLGVDASPRSFHLFRRAQFLRRFLDRRRLGRDDPHLDLEILEGLITHGLFHRLLVLDVGESLARQVGSHADLGAVQADLVVDHLLDLAEVGGDVEIEVAGQLGHLGLGAAHFQFGIVLLDLVADFAPACRWRA